MRIALVHRLLTLRGGLEKNVWLLAQGLVERGHDVTAIVSEVRGPAPAGIDARIVPARGRAGAARWLAFDEDSAMWIAAGTFDLVQGFDLTTHQDVLRVGRGLKRVYDEVLAPTRHPLDRWLRRRSRADRALLELETRMLAPGSARVIVANSRVVARELVDRAGVDEARVAVIWNGIDVGAWNPRAAAGGRKDARARLGLAAGDRVVLHLGTGFRRKALDVTLRAFATLARGDRRARLVVVGRDGATWRYRLLAQRLGVSSRVTFAGAIDATPSLYGAADVLSAPSRYEPFANTILEALACGVPPIHSRCGGASELLEAASLGELVLADAEDAAELAALLARALDGGELLAARCRAAAERRPQRAVVDDYEALYRRLAAAPARRASAG